MTDTRTADRQAILVVGYYRSGTSALCGSLVDLGVQISSDAESNEANPKGFFESTELIKFDIRVLDLLSSYWSDLSALPEGWIDRADIQLQRDELAAILTRQFAGAPLVAVKHPHLCRLLPLYLQATRDAGYAVKVLHTHRSPYAMATSQAKKNNLTRAHAIALWTSYITSAEHGARGLPRAWLRYPELIEDADGAVRRSAGPDRNRNRGGAQRRFRLEGAEPVGRGRGRGPLRPSPASPPRSRPRSRAAPTPKPGTIFAHAAPTSPASWRNSAARAIALRRGSVRGCWSRSRQAAGRSSRLAGAPIRCVRPTVATRWSRRASRRCWTAPATGTARFPASAC